MNRIFTLLLSAILVTSFCYGQKVVNTTGKSITNQGVYIDYAVGEIAIATLQNSQNIVTQGILQPNYQIISATNEAFDALFTFNAYPNPVTAQLTIETDYPDFENISITNIAGQEVYKASFNYDALELSNFPIGTYFVHLQSKVYIKTIKIIKK
jgi:hypothetical protein